MNREKRLSRFLPLVMIAIYFTTFSAGIEAMLGIPAVLIEFGLIAFLGICVVSNFPALFEKMDKNIVLILFSTAILAVANILFFPEANPYFIHELVYFVMICLPTMVLTYIVRNAEDLFQNLLQASRMLVAVSMLFFGMMLIRGNLNQFNSGKYSMGFGYASTLPTIIMIMSFIRGSRWKDMLGAVMMVLSIIAFGSRGPLLSIAVFTCLYSVRILFAKRRFVILGIAVLAMIAVMLLYRQILDGLMYVLDLCGIQSRTIQLLLRANVHLSGRETIYTAVKTEILDAPFRIRGICSDWVLLGVYVHNLVLELLYQGGVLLGGAAVLVIGLCAIDTVFRAPMDAAGSIEIVFACMALTHLSYSNSLWRTYTFWVWIAMLMRRRSMRITDLLKMDEIVNAAELL